MWAAIAKFIPQILGAAGGFANAKAAAAAERYKADMDDRRKLADQIAKREEFKLNAPRTSAQQAAFGDFLSNYKPYVPSNMGPESTWAKPISGEGFGANAQASGRALGEEALRRLLEKDYNYQLPGETPPQSLARPRGLHPNASNRGAV